MTIFSKLEIFKNNKKVYWPFSRILFFPQPVAVLHPIVTSINEMQQIDSLHFNEGFSGMFLSSVEWHPRRSEVAAVCDQYGNVVIKDVLRGRTILLRLNVKTIKIKCVCLFFV